MLASRRPWLEGMVLYTEGESVPPGNPIKADRFSNSPSPTCPTNQTPQGDHIIYARSLFPPSGATDPQPPPAGHIPAALAPSSGTPQRKRKRDVDAGDGKEKGEEKGEEKPLAHKRRGKARLGTLPEEQQSDAREGRQNEHEQPPVQLQPRRSTRIQERKNKGAALPKVENPAKPASRKRTVRKKQL